MPVTIKKAAMRYRNPDGTYTDVEAIGGRAAVIDPALSEQSVNPVQNKAVAIALAGIGRDVSELKSSVTQTVTVTGTDPVITAADNRRYVCGEVYTLSLTPPASGICDVVFTSGTTATVLTVPNTVKWPSWFDPTALEASVTYEINICDGLAVVATWAV